MMNRIVIESWVDVDEMVITVDVSEKLTVLEAIGLLEVAKLQHLQSKHTHVSRPTLRR